MKKFSALIIIMVLLLTTAGCRGSQDSRYVNILCLGIDKEEKMNEISSETGSIGQSDAIFVVSIDKIENHIRVISIPRDTMVTLEMFDVVGKHMGTYEGQITLQYAYGDGEKMSCDLTKKRVQEVLGGIEIDDCIAVNFTALKKITSIMGGIPVYMDEDYTFIRPEFVQGETVILTADLAHDFCRARLITEDGSAYKRIHRLQVFLSSALNRAKELLKEDPECMIEMYDALQGYYYTDMNIGTVSKLVYDILDCTLADCDVYTLDGYQDSSKVYEEFYLDTDSVGKLMEELFKQ